MLLSVVRKSRFSAVWGLTLQPSCFILDCVITQHVGIWSFLCWLQTEESVLNASNIQAGQGGKNSNLLTQHVPPFAHCVIWWREDLWELKAQQSSLTPLLLRLYCLLWLTSNSQTLPKYLWKVPSKNNHLLLQYSSGYHKRFSMSSMHCSSWGTDPS